MGKAAGIIAAAVGMTLAGWYWPALQAAGELSRDALSGGQLWRLWSGHWLHLDIPHAAINLLALTIILLLALRWHLLRALLWLSLLLMPLLSLALLLWRPDLQWYVGLSGLLHGALVWLLLRHGGHAAWVGLALITGKLLWQALHGVEPWVVQEAHWLGALLGAVLAWLPRKRPQKLAGTES